MERIKMKLNERCEIICPQCGHKMIWQSDYNPEEVFPEDEEHTTITGGVSFYACPNCQAEYYAFAHNDNLVGIDVTESDQQ